MATLSQFDGGYFYDENFRRVRGGCASSGYAVDPALRSSDQRNMSPLKRIFVQEALECWCRYRRAVIRDRILEERLSQTND